MPGSLWIVLWPDDAGWAGVQRADDQTPTIDLRLLGGVGLKIADHLVEIRGTALPRLYFGLTHDEPPVANTESTMLRTTRPAVNPLAPFEPIPAVAIAAPSRFSSMRLARRPERNASVGQTGERSISTA